MTDRATGIFACTVAAIASSVLAAPAALAEVTGVEITSRTPFADGRSFGDVGAYEQLDGTVRFAIDPNNARNAVIADLDLAPRNASGMVELSAEISILTPTVRERGNGIAMISVPNRGNKLSLVFNRPDSTTPPDGFLMNRGYTMVWVGWEFDIADSPDRMNVSVPVTTDADHAPIGGLGFAAVRDVASWVRYADDAIVSAQKTLGFGISQSGRYLRTFLYLGFNADEQGRQVFDAVWAHIAGASRLDLNRRGAAPAALGQFDATSFPFADAAMRDPVSGLVEGTLDNDRAREHQPLIFYTNSSVEYWGGGRAAALVHTTPDGASDIELPANVRFYHLAGTQHGPGPFPPAEAVRTQLPANPLNYWWPMRALAVAMEQWLLEGTEPPPSAHARREDGTLVAATALDFPSLPGVQTPEILPGGRRAPNGFADAGAGAALPFLVPAVDRDGNEISGILHPELSVPLATYTGWSFNAADYGDPKSMVALTGSYKAFPATTAARSAAGDPRRSIEERYASRSAYLELVRAAAGELVGNRYLLPGDVDPIVKRAGEHWDLLTGSSD